MLHLAKVKHKGTSAMKYLTNNENKEQYKKESSDLEDEYENKKTRKIGIS